MLQVELMRGMPATRSTTLGYGDKQLSGLGLQLGVPCRFRPRLRTRLSCIQGVAHATASRLPHEHFLHLSPAAHLFERTLDAHWAPGTDKSPTLTALRVYRWGQQATAHGAHTSFSYSCLVFPNS